MKKCPPKLKVRVEYEPNRFSSYSLSQVYEQLKPVQSRPVTNEDKKDEVGIKMASKVGDHQ